MLNETEQLSFKNIDTQADNQPVVCLGITFKNEEERREYFREELRNKLPDLKKIEGFPIGDDEDIIALSDPPYFTICPNPWLNEFITQWESEKPQNVDEKIVEPLSSDISEGKNDPIYNAHSYHTKVPYKAIMRYLLHYTNPGDIIFDGFCGSGMTGVAAEMCGNREIIEEMGYIINEKGEIFEKTEDSGEEEKVSKIGQRNALLADLAPAATFISYNYNTNVNVDNMKNVLGKELNTFLEKYKWSFLTLIDRKNANTLSKQFLEIDLLDKEKVFNFFNNKIELFASINYIVWSDVYLCPNCSSEIVYWEATVNKESKEVKKEFSCHSCGMNLDKKQLERVYNTSYDIFINETIEQPKQVPVLINYTYNKKRFEKTPDEFDLLIIKKFENLRFPFWVPIDKLSSGVKTNEPIRLGFTHVHHFYTKKNLYLLGAYLKELQETPGWQKLFLHGSVLPKLTKMNRYMPQHGSRALVGPMANALYFPPMNVENNVLHQLEFQYKKIIKALNKFGSNVITTQSSTMMEISDNSIDYIFLDPPFGANIMYSELSFVRECWLGIKTNNQHEAIENKAQGKSLNNYTQIMTRCLTEAYRILKPGKWITVEFSNTQASVWNSIQHAMQEAGFVIASVDALDKKRGGLHAMITTTAVKQDLVISAYKPIENIRKSNVYSDASIEEIFSFIDEHLKYVPTFKGNKKEIVFIPERDPRILYDRMVAYFVRKGINITLSSLEFQNYLRQKYVIQDGMVFLEHQALEYNKRRILAKEFINASLFVTDETSAIEWLRQQLMKKPQTRQDLHPNFMKEIQHIAKHEILPELDDLLHQNFLRYEGDGHVPDQIASYLHKNYKDLRGLDSDDAKLKEKALNRWYVPDPNKQADLEKLREKTLLREFEGYIEELSKSKKKLKQFRTEAIRAGFKKAWGDKDYQKIVTVGDRLPESVIQEDDKLLMYYDNAQIRLGL